MSPLVKGLAILAAVVILADLATCLLCDSNTDCFGEYRHCCGGYCKKSCNNSCTASSDCGSLGHLQEKCCNGRCVGIDSVCPQSNVKKTKLSPSIIAVLVVCIVVFAAVGACALFSYFCKCGIYSRRSRSMSVFTPCTGRNAGDKDASNPCVVAVKVSTPGGKTQAQFFAETSWVGKDFVQSKGAYTNNLKATDSE